MSLIAESEMPERYGIAESKLYVILDDESVRNTFDLLVAFLTTSDFKSVVVNAKIGYGGGDYIVTHPHLVEEKGFPDIAYFGFLASEIVYQVRIVEVNLIHLTQSPNLPVSSRSCAISPASSM